jgi:hypothetical protein
MTKEGKIILSEFGKYIDYQKSPLAKGESFLLFFLSVFA